MIKTRRMEMKTFDDLIFKDRYTKEADDIFKQQMIDYRPIKQAKLDFNNGYGISVITGSYTYTNNDDEFEIAVIKDGEICHHTPITNDVIGHLTKEEVTEIMRLVQEL